MRVKLTSGARSERCLSVMAAPNLPVMAAPTLPVMAAPTLTVMAAPTLTVMAVPTLTVMAALVAAIHPQSVGQWRGVPPRDRRRMAPTSHALGLAFGQTRGAAMTVRCATEPPIRAVT